MFLMLRAPAHGFARATLYLFWAGAVDTISTGARTSKTGATEHVSAQCGSYMWLFAAGKGLMQLCELDTYGLLSKHIISEHLH